MAGVDLSAATIVDIGKLLKQKELSPVELTEATLERIERINPKLNAYTTVTADHAMRRAERAESEITGGNYKGPLHGIPYSLKDLVDTKGIRTTYGYSSHQDYIPEQSSEVFTRLEESGAILVGKVNCHFRRDVPVECFNPWDTERSPGISSAGSGSAVAASLGLASIGSDTGGSVRLPAAWSGVVGIRATLGLISRHNLFGPSWSFDQAGPLAKTVEDAAIVLQVVAGYDPKDPISVHGPVPDYQAGLHSDIKGLRVGVLEEYVGASCNEEVESAVLSAVNTLKGLGAQVSNVTIKNVDEFPDIHNTIVELESSAYYYEVFSKERLDRIDDDMKDRLARGARISMSEYLRAKKRLAFLQQEVDRVLREVDVVVCPTSLTPPLKISETKSKTMLRGQEIDAGSLSLKCTAIASDTGLPSISLPCGMTNDFLPIGLLVMGRRLEENLIMRIAYAYEQSTGWHLKHPKFG